MAAARIIKEKRPSAAANSPYLNNTLAVDEDDTDDFDDEDPISMQNLLEDLWNGPDDCAFSSSSQSQCLSNRQVYALLSNRTDLMRTSKAIEKQLRKPDEHVCTSVDLSTCRLR